MTINPLLRAVTDSADPQAIVLKDLQTRVTALERWAGVPASAQGFHVTRSSNEAALANCASKLITFTTVRADRGMLGSGWPASADFEIPGETTQRALYVVSAGVYWAAQLANVYVSIRVNGVAVVSCDMGTSDRRYVGATPILLRGFDLVDVSVYNLSGSSLTITSYPGDSYTPPVPYLSVWRIT